MKKIILWVLLVTFILGMSGYSALAQEAPKEKLRLAHITIHYREPVYVFKKNAIRELAAKDGHEMISMSSASDEAVELRNVEDIITRGVDGVIFCPVSKGTTAIEEFTQEGIPVVVLDCIAYDANFPLYVTGFSFEVGQLQAEYVVEKMGPKGNVIILQGAFSGENVANEITAGYFDVLNKYPDIKVLVHKRLKLWDERLAMEAVEDAITRYGDKIDAVLANNSQMAMGAVAALKAAGLQKKVVTTGADADLIALKAIIAGDHDMDVDKRPIEMAVQAYKAIVKIARGESTEADMVIKNGTKWTATKYVEPKAITVENVAEMTYRWPELKEVL